MSNYDHDTHLQQAGLKALGYAPGPLDGLSGPKTRKAYAASVRARYGSPVETVSSTAEKLVAFALKEVGVKERPKNSNRGKRVQEYQSSTWLDGSGWPWCAAFICWLCKEAGVPDSKRPQTAGAWDFERWAKKRSSPVTFYKVGKTAIKKGDILVYTFSHIGLAAADQTSSSVNTIEGNTDASGSREGGGVYEKTRRLSQIRSVIRFK
tara:strand:- start:4188 stop:4811 length:624 start_codon:yes stop_codon:yes gene_type:complete